MMMMHGTMEWMAPMMVFLGVIGGVLVVAVVVGIVFAVRALTDRTDGPARRSDGALQVLEERFARGEIDREEFIERRDTLRGGRG